MYSTKCEEPSEIIKADVTQSQEQGKVLMFFCPKDVLWLWLYSPSSPPFHDEKQWERLSWSFRVRDMLGSTSLLTLEHFNQPISLRNTFTVHVKFTTIRYFFIRVIHWPFPFDFSDNKNISYFSKISVSLEAPLCKCENASFK